LVSRYQSEDILTSPQECGASIRKPLGKPNVQRSIYLLVIFFAMIQMAPGQSLPSEKATLPDKPEPAAQYNPANTANSDTSADAVDSANSDNSADAQSHRSPMVPPSGDDYQPITGAERLHWLLTSTFGPTHLFAGVVVAGIRTAEHHPEEYNTHWDGFADRFGMRMSGIVTGNVIEAGVGSLMGEDPRYFREPENSPLSRLGNVVKQTFVARHRDGSYGLAYARYTAVFGNNFLSNTWRPRSEANTHSALVRSGEGFLGRIVSNAFREFWPDLKNLIHKKE
jgi:hypothetical protein